MLRLIAAFLVMVLVAPSGALAQDDPHNSRHQFVTVLRDDINQLQRYAHQVHFDSTHTDSMLAEHFQQAASCLMRFMYWVDWCADCERYDSTACDSLRAASADFGLRIRMMGRGRARWAEFGIPADSVFFELRRKSKGMMTFVAQECRRGGRGE